MAVAGLSSLLTEVEAAVGASRPDAVDASVKAFRANAPPLEVIRAAARGVATHYDRASRAAPRSLAILGAAANLISVMQPRFHALPVLQVVSYVASEKKASTPAKPPLVVSGEVTHLGRSFLFAVRAGDVVEAESIFLGIDDEARAKVLAVTSVASESACIEAILALLREGYAATSIAEGLAVDAARRIVASPGYDAEAARRLLFAHASRFVLAFSRTNERLYALFQAGLRLRSPEPSAPLAPPASAASEGEELCHLAGEFDTRKPREAAARVRAYVARGYSTSRMLDVLANYACRDAARANDGFNVLLADACTAEFLAVKAPAVPMALAKMIAASPKDQVAYESWAPLFSP